MMKARTFVTSLLTLNFDYTKLVMNDIITKRLPLRSFAVVFPSTLMNIECIRARRWRRIRPKLT